VRGKVSKYSLSILVLPLCPQTCASEIQHGSATVTANPLHSGSASHRTCIAWLSRGRCRGSDAKHGDRAPWLQRIDDMNSKATRASVCNQPMKQAGGFEDSTEFQPMRAPTIPVRERPTTTHVCKHNETARKRATQGCQAHRGQGIASRCSTIRCARDDDGRASHRAPLRSNGDEW